MTSILALPQEMFEQIMFNLSSESFFSCWRVSKQFQEKCQNTVNVLFLKTLRELGNFRKKRTKYPENEIHDSKTALKILFLYSRLFMIDFEIIELSTIYGFMKYPGFDEEKFNNYKIAMIQSFFYKNSPVCPPIDKAAICSPFLFTLTFDAAKKLNFVERVNNQRKKFIRIFERLNENFTEREFKFLIELNWMNEKLKGIFPNVEKRKLEISDEGERKKIKL